MTQDRLAQFLLAVRTARGPARGTALAALAAAAQNSPLVLAAFRSLNDISPATAVEYVARMAEPLPQALVLLAAPALSDRSVPLGLRLAAAGKLLASLPDTAASVGPIVRSLTLGLGRTKSLDRMIQLQSRVAECRTLDDMVRRAEKTAKYRCPDCGVRRSKAGLAKHRWTQHRVRDGLNPTDAVAAAAAALAKSRDAEAVDRAHLIAAAAHDRPDLGRVHQILLTRLPPVGDDLLPLLKAAVEAGCGLCPVCFSQVPPGFPPLAPPLAVGDGAVSGNGYRIDARRGALHWPLADPEPIPVPAAVPPRAFASRIVVPLACVALFAAAFVPDRWAKPVGIVGWLALAGGIGYAAAVLLRKSVPDATDAAADAAWNVAAPRVGRSPAAVQFLTRLCRVSLDVGTPEARTERVWELAEHAAVLARKGPEYSQLAAAVAVLQAFDAARFGRDPLPGLLDVFAPLWTAEQPPGYGDAAAEILRAAEAFTDPLAARLRAGLLAAAFEAGFAPADLSVLAELAPGFARLWAGPAEWRAAAFAVWQSRRTRAWEQVAEAETVFEFAKKSPASGRVLAAFPDAVLVARFDRTADAVLGAVIVGTRGVSVAGVTVADPEAEVRIEKRANTAVLQFGPHRVALAKRVSGKIAGTLSGWLTYRANVLLPLAERDIATTAPPALARLESLASVTCEICEAKAVVRVGEVGREVPAT
jgi:predicted RNA-binding Zn-ribbon protein involved in translation (DUF1610 family)